MQLKTVFFVIFLDKATAVDFFAWLTVGVKHNKPARGSVSLILSQIEARG